MYEDGDGLADSLRDELPQEVSDFFGGLKVQDAYRFSSTVGWRIQKLYPHVDALDELGDLQEELAHAAKAPCDELTSRHKVLCVHQNKDGRLEFARHNVGKCPFILEFLEKKKEEREAL